MLAAAAPGEVVRVPRPSTLNVAVGGEIIPCGISSFREKTDQGGKAFHPFQVDSGYSFTFHKVQGVTVPRIVVDLNARPAKLGRLQHGSLYVAITRVTSANGIRIMPLRSSFSHLEKLKPNKELLLWLKGRQEK